ncbi:MAG: hypothetical protein AAGE01_14370 [Pseudomonadota bacterium]
MYLAQSDYAITLDWLIRLGLASEETFAETPSADVDDAEEI